MGGKELAHARRRARMIEAVNISASPAFVNYSSAARVDFHKERERERERKAEM